MLTSYAFKSYYFLDWNLQSKLFTQLGFVYEHMSALSNLQGYGSKPIDAELQD